MSCKIKSSLKKNSYSRPTSNSRSICSSSDGRNSLSSLKQALSGQSIIGSLKKICGSILPGKSDTNFDKGMPKSRTSFRSPECSVCNSCPSVDTSCDPPITGCDNNDSARYNLCRSLEQEKLMFQIRILEEKCIRESELREIIAQKKRKIEEEVHLLKQEMATKTLSNKKETVSLRTKISGLHEKLNEVDRARNVLEGKCNSLKSELCRLKERLAELEDTRSKDKCTIKNLESIAESQRCQIEVLEGEIRSELCSKKMVEGKLKRCMGQLFESEKCIKDLQCSLNEKSNQMKSLQARLCVAEGKVTSLEDKNELLMSEKICLMEKSKPESVFSSQTGGYAPPANTLNKNEMQYHGFESGYNGYEKPGNMFAPMETQSTTSQSTATYGKYMNMNQNPNMFNGQAYNWPCFHDNYRNFPNQ